MAERSLDAEERALWARVAATVRPLEGKARPLKPTFPGVGRGPSPARAAISMVGDGPRPALGKVQKENALPPANTLDGGWDRRLRRGAVLPDRSIDLHGHTLASAHAALDSALAEALADDVRVLLVVTGKPPRPGQHGRGLIRASIGDWLAHSRHSGRIAAIRNAHPRHGGAGALYLILRRRRGE